MEEKIIKLLTKSQKIHDLENIRGRIIGDYFNIDYGDVDKDMIKFINDIFYKKQKEIYDTITL